MLILTFFPFVSQGENGLRHAVQSPVGSGTMALPAQSVEVRVRLRLRWSRVVQSPRRLVRETGGLTVSEDIDVATARD